ncbi:unnamed protein product [Paramecium sonneborni]|uniref:Uncharacterized protein n=1 Tax=Paramecium sonneborni TaxID=65129 RepID=A0A8S1QZ34_9CILI|nr:unnamed protein product [Paramecium sonneborni]
MNHYKKILQCMTIIGFYFQDPQNLKQQIDFRLRELEIEHTQSKQQPELDSYYQKLKQIWPNQKPQSNQNQGIKILDLDFDYINTFQDFKNQFELLFFYLENYKQVKTLREVTINNYIEVVNENKQTIEELETLTQSQTLLKEENEKLKSQILQLQNDIKDLKNILNKNQLFYQESQELKQSKIEIVKLQQDNFTLQNQFHKLCDQMELDKQNVLQNQVMLLEQQMKSQAEQLASANKEIKNYTNEIQKLSDINNKFLNSNFEFLGIRSIPIFKGVKAYFYPVIYLMELITPLKDILVVKEKVSLIIYQFINYIRKEKIDQIQAQTAIQLQELIQVQDQNDNQANDFLFSIIDHLSKVIVKNEQQKSQIATIIQAEDSPIFNLFFFLQRAFPINIEIQQNEVPLINSIKYVRYFDTIITPQVEFSKYLMDLITLEGQENKLENNDATFNFIIFPQYLVFNTSELSQQQADIKISQNIAGSFLNPTQNDIQYQLISIIQLIREDNQINYIITLCKNNIWVQIKQGHAYLVDINSILTFQQPHNNKELLIYEKLKI